MYSHHDEGPGDMGEFVYSFPCPVIPIGKGLTACFGFLGSSFGGQNLFDVICAHISCHQLQRRDGGAPNISRLDFPLPSGFIEAMRFAFTPSLGEDKRRIFHCRHHHRRRLHQPFREMQSPQKDPLSGNEPRLDVSVRILTISSFAHAPITRLTFLH